MGRMSDQNMPIEKIPAITMDVIKGIISIKINLIRISKNKDLDPSKKNLDYLRSKMNEVASKEFIKTVFDLINKDTLIDYIYHCTNLTKIKLSKEDNIDFSFEQILDETFYNE
jgi:hypothetical protein